MDVQDNIAQGNEQQSAEDSRIKNLQAEMNRKTSNLDSKLEQINQQLQQLSLLGNNVQPSNNNTNQRPDFLTDPEGYERYIEQKFEAKLNDRMSAQQRQQSEIASLVSNFPELSDGSSELSQAAIKAYNNLSQQEKGMPGAYKLAVQGAALDLGILPKSKRNANQGKSISNESDDLGARGNSEAGARQDNRKKQKIEDSTLSFAQLLGKDINDPKYLERLQKAASRTVWSKAKNRNEY